MTYKIDAAATQQGCVPPRTMASMASVVMSPLISLSALNMGLVFTSIDRRERDQSA